MTSHRRRARLTTVAISRVLTSLIVGALVGAALAACSAPSAARLIVTPGSALIDQPVSVEVTGLPAGATVTLGASATDARGVLWRSHAAFRVPSSGRVSTTDAARGGSWTGIQPMGLFTDMTPSGTSSAIAFALKDRTFTMNLTASLNGTVVARARTVRAAPLADGVRAKTFTVSKNGVDGILYSPAHARAGTPTVLLFGGSEGGMSDTFGAKTLAGDGYPTLTIAYFGAPGVPATLNDVPIEYFARAGRLLQQQTHTRPGHVAIWGISRGSEAAVLAAANYPTIFDAVVAAVPNDRVGGPGQHTTDAAWTLHGKEIAPAQQYSNDSDPADEPSTFLPVQRVRGPILTICGGMDEIWDSCQHASGIRAARAGSAAHAGDRFVAYPTAGHTVGFAWRYFSFTSLTDAGEENQPGGTVQANALAMAAARTQVLAFLDRLRTTAAS